jgi:hypothetical protein
MKTSGRILLALLVAAALLGCQFASSLLQQSANQQREPAFESTADWIIPVTGTETAQPEAPAAVTITTPKPVRGVYFITVYFTDRNRLKAHKQPYEIAVKRPVPTGGTGPAAALQEFFLGPTAEEQARGLMAVTDGYTGFHLLYIDHGIAWVHLTGGCKRDNYPYTIKQPIAANLHQAADIQMVKILNAEDMSIDLDGPGDSGPECSKGK